MNSIIHNDAWGKLNLIEGGALGSSPHNGSWGNDQLGASVQYTQHVATT